MNRIKPFVFLFAFYVIGNLCMAQIITFEGVLVADGDVEGIHIINESLKRYTTSNAEGEFNIDARLSDTIYISSLRYKHKRFRISALQFEAKKLVINLEEDVNQLDQVVIGRIITGDLATDLETSGIEAPINFWDLGLPGYKGKPLTQSERRLAHADAGPMFTPTSINVHKILNKISGRTKRLKERVRVETETALMNSIKDNFGAAFFEIYILEAAKRQEFWFFCQEDINFMKRCKDKADIEVIIFLEEKYHAYLGNIAATKD